MINDMREALDRSECLTRGRIDSAVHQWGGECPHCHFKYWEDDAEELDTVVLKRPVGPIPAGSKGTVVAVWGEHRIAYTVEFTSPDHLIEVTLDDIELLDEMIPKGLDEASQ